MPTIPKSKPLPWLPQRLPHVRRKRTNQKFYNSAKWRNSAKSKEASTPFCEDCLLEGVSTDATGRNGVTDHVYPVNKALDDFENGRITKYKLDWYLYHPENQRRLCHRHHNKKSGKEAHQ